MLKAGYLEGWKLHQTYSGCPQGGVISPILSNIYLHELDSYMTQLKSQFNKGKIRRTNPEYKLLSNQIYCTRAKIRKMGKRPELMRKFKELKQAIFTIPSKDTHDENYRRLKYCRYADDFLLGFVGTKKEATGIMASVKTFLENNLLLQTADDKTGIKHAKSGTQFLNYSIKTYSTAKIVRVQVNGSYTTKRSVIERLLLEVPEGKVQKFCQKYGYGNWRTLKIAHRPELLNASDVEINQKTSKSKVIEMPKPKKTQARKKHK